MLLFSGVSNQIPGHNPFGRTTLSDKTIEGYNFIDIKWRVLYFFYFKMCISVFLVSYSDFYLLYTAFVRPKKC